MEKNCIQFSFKQASEVNCFLNGEYIIKDFSYFKIIIDAN